MASTSRLFKPLKLGRQQLLNRLALAPLTRIRNDDSHVPLQPMVTEYYSQRASSPGTLLISEATLISPQAGGNSNTPGIYSDAQIASWKKVVEAVHAKGSVIYLQLWALGRVASLEVLKAEVGESAKVVGAGDIPADGLETPTPLTEEKIHEYIGWFTQAAKNAIAAGFDGVEIHGANGYLVDQFLQDVSNNRTDAWGGSVEKRARFALEVVKSITEAIGGDRTGIRLSPYSGFQSMKMSPEKIRPQFQYLVRELKKHNLAFIHLVEPRVNGTDIREDVGDESLKDLVDIWDNQSPVLLAGGFTPQTAREAVDKEYPNNDIIVVFGRHFISNPDLVFRIKNGIELNPYDRSTFYLPGTTKGYTDYPFSKDFLEQTRQVNGQAVNVNA